MMPKHFPHEMQESHRDLTGNERIGLLLNTIKVWQISCDFHGQLTEKISPNAIILYLAQQKDRPSSFSVSFCMQFFIFNIKNCRTLFAHLQIYTLVLHWTFAAQDICVKE